MESKADHSRTHALATEQQNPIDIPVIKRCHQNGLQQALKLTNNTIETLANTMPKAKSNKHGALTNALLLE
jgi:hypothetical protein